MHPHPVSDAIFHNFIWKYNIEVAEIEWSWFYNVRGVKRDKKTYVADFQFLNVDSEKVLKKLDLCPV